MTAAEHSKLLYLIDAIDACKNAPDKIAQLFVIATPHHDYTGQFNYYIERLIAAYDNSNAIKCIEEGKKIRNEIR